MWNTIAFLGTGPCNPTDQRNGALGQWAIVAVVVLACVMLMKLVIIKHGRPLWQKILAVLLCIGVVVFGLLGMFIISIGTACSG
jgi:hypothetical protein